MKKKETKVKKTKLKETTKETAVNVPTLKTFQRVIYARLVMEDAKLTIENVLDEIRDLEFLIKQDIYEEAK